MTFSHVQAPFKLTRLEVLCSVAATLVFDTLGADEDLVTMSDICERPQYGFTAKATHDSVGPKYVRITDIREGAITWDTVPHCSCDAPDSYLLASGDVLIARTGSVGKSVRVLDVPELSVFASYLIRLHPRHPAHGRFVSWFLQTDQFWNQVLRMSRGSAIKNVNGQMLSSLSMPQPTQSLWDSALDFLDEFRAYARGDRSEVPLVPDFLAGIASSAEKLHNAFACIERISAKTTPARAHSLVDSYLGFVFGGGEDRWEVKPLSAVCSFENGDRGTNYPSKSVRTPTGVPFINAGHLADDGIDMRTMDFIPRERFDLLTNGKIRAGDILFCLRGSLGKCASVGSLSEGAIASSLVIVRPQDVVTGPFILAFLRSPKCSEMIESFRNGAAQPNLSVRSLARFPVPVPSLAEQESVVDTLGRLRALTKRLQVLYEHRMAALEALEKSLLHEALAGMSLSS